MTEDDLKDNTLHHFENLAQRAREEPSAPTTDVSGRVLETIQSRSHLCTLEPELWIVAAAALVAACAAIVLFSMHPSYDPFLPLFEPFGVALK